VIEVKNIKRICGKITLFINNEQGTHLKFIGKMSTLDLGTDLSVDLFN
jgi:hypothetical protein